MYKFQNILSVYILNIYLIYLGICTFYMEEKAIKLKIFRIEPTASPRLKSKLQRRRAQALLEAIWRREWRPPCSCNDQGARFDQLASEDKAVKLAPGDSAAAMTHSLWVLRESPAQLAGAECALFAALFRSDVFTDSLRASHSTARRSLHCAVSTLREGVVCAEN